MRRKRNPIHAEESLTIEAYQQWQEEATRELTRGY